MIYPPILKSTQDAFLASSIEYGIDFTLPAFVSEGEIGHIQIKIVQQTNNSYVVDLNKYLDGIIYTNLPERNNIKSVYTAIIRSSDLQEQWKPGALYKIQMRFGSNPPWNISSGESFGDWKKRQIDTNAFSEWSTVMIIKAINSPEFEIKNKESPLSSTIYRLKREDTTTPLFEGSFYLPENNHESLDKFKFDLYKGQEIVQENLIESSGWVQDRGSDQRKFRFKHILKDGEDYSVMYSIRTINGYEAQIIHPYYFFVTIADLGEIENLILTIKDNERFNLENGCIDIYLSSSEQITGNYVITRTDEKTNFTIWEDIKFLYFFQDSLQDRLIFRDYTVESGIRYKYAIQKQNYFGKRTQQLYEDILPKPHCVNFQYSFLYRNGIQLKLKLNQQINNFKHTVLRNKQDTLGSKFPYLSQNGEAYYAEFPISGLIAFELDEDNTFFTFSEDGLYFNKEKVIPLDKFENFSGKRSYSPKVIKKREEDKEHKKQYDFGDLKYAYKDDEIASQEFRQYNHNRNLLNDNNSDNQFNDATETNYEYIISHDLIDNNIFIERKFRECVEYFLNSFNYKLFKSPTEGNIIIGLTNVQLQPITNLGRMLMSFSATAYELSDFSIYNLNKFGINLIGEYNKPIENEQTYQSFGQIQIVSENMFQLNEYKDIETNNIYEIIKKQQNISLEDGYRYNLKKVTSFWVEPYPKKNMDFEIAEYKNELSELIILYPDEDDHYEEKEKLKNKIEDLEQINEILQKYKMIEGYLILGLEKGNVYISSDKTYAIKDDINVLKLVSAKYPMIINYICELELIKDKKQKIEKNIDVSLIWGQISGIFTDTPKVLQSYRYDCLLEKGYRVYNKTPIENSVIKVKRMNMEDDIIVVDDTFFNVYKTLDIMQVIKQEVQKQVEYEYGTTFKEVDGELTNGTIYYNFGIMDKFTLEADPGTIFYLNGEKKRVSNNGYIEIGSREKLEYPTSFYPSAIIKNQAEGTNENNTQINSLTLQGGKPQYISVNYWCTTRQVTKEVIDDGI